MSEQNMADAEILEKLERMAANSAFTRHNRIDLVSAERDHAVMRMAVHPDSLNARGIVHGGALYAIADNACGHAAHTDGRSYVTQAGTMHFISPVSEGTITAEATLVHRGRRTCLFRVEIRGDSGYLAATGEFTFFCTDPE